MKYDMNDMKKIFSVLIFVGLFSVLVFTGVSTVSAQAPDATLQANPANLQADTPGQVGSNNPTNSLFQLVTCQGIDDPRTSAIEKECNYEQLVATVSRLIQFALYILIPIILGMIVYIGFKYLTANGDSGKLADAKRMITPLLIGIFLIFAAWLIVYTFLDKILADNVSGVPKSTIVPAGIK